MLRVYARAAHISSTIAYYTAPRADSIKRRCRILQQSDCRPVDELAATEFPVEIRCVKLSVDIRGHVRR